MISPISMANSTQQSQQQTKRTHNSVTGTILPKEQNAEIQNSTKANRERALKDGSLILHKGKEYKIFGFSIYKTNDEYEYIADGKETIRYIKTKFGIKDNKIKELNPYIKDDNYQPEKGKSIYLPVDAFKD